MPDRAARRRHPRGPGEAAGVRARRRARPDAVYRALVAALRRERRPAGELRDQPVIWTGDRWEAPGDCLVGADNRDAFLDAVTVLPETLRDDWVFLGAAQRPAEAHWRRLLIRAGERYGGQRQVPQRAADALRRAYRHLGKLPERLGPSTPCLLDDQGRLHSPGEAAAGTFLINDDPALASAAQARGAGRVRRHSDPQGDRVPPGRRRPAAVGAAALAGTEYGPGRQARRHAADRCRPRPPARPELRLSRRRARLCGLRPRPLAHGGQSHGPARPDHADHHRGRASRAPVPSRRARGHRAPRTTTWATIRSSSTRSPAPTSCAGPWPAPSPSWPTQARSASRCSATASTSCCAAGRPARCSANSSAARSPGSPTSARRRGRRGRRRRGSGIARRCPQQESCPRGACPAQRAAPAEPSRSRPPSPARPARPPLPDLGLVRPRPAAEQARRSALACRALAAGADTAPGRRAAPRKPRTTARSAGGARR